MSSQADESPPAGPLRSAAGAVVTLSNLAMLLAGVLAGYSIGVLGRETVALPLIGSAPGLAVGSVGLLAAVVVYRQWGCCTGGSAECDCSGECGDSRSV
ncbi:MAG: hypothetical protein ACI8TL_001565 [Natronomonas sp.]|jgi:hypothetical protein